MRLRYRLGEVGAIFAAALLALSPGMVYFSRDFIHEIPLIFFTLWLVVWCEPFTRAGRGQLSRAKGEFGRNVSLKDRRTLHPIYLVSKQKGPVALRTLPVQTWGI